MSAWDDDADLRCPRCGETFDVHDLVDTACDEEREERCACCGNPNIYARLYLLDVQREMELCRYSQFVPDVVCKACADLYQMVLEEHSRGWEHSEHMCRCYFPMTIRGALVTDEA